MTQPDDDDINAMAKRLLTNGWTDAAAPAPAPASASGVYMVHWRKGGIQDAWIISRDGQKEWSGYAPADLAEKKRMIEKRGGKIVEAKPLVGGTP